ncbi:NACHT, LRR and PYD domains-containing protein 3-like [Sinocyclocheilus grahami]|uniref:NACHT, LRR and PYD domains-containing protein 3-like n=1 Tax=Sinocyclocheilus grahami TaxID=75366 RepID=UPI0007ACE34C|nr:PREDICTED: NACHT, LRR and PYD domains-containing protein 3-like [Sinocyclocheilus grahami]
MEDTRAFRDGDVSPGCSQFQEDRSNSSEPSCVSMKSNRSMQEPLRFDGRHTSPDLSQSDRSISSKLSCVSMKSNQSMNPPVTFEGRHTSPDLSEQLTDTPGIFKGKRMPSNLSRDSQLVQSRFKSKLLSKFGHLYEGTATQGNPTLLNDIYTELYITESESGEINNEHEVRQIETQSRRAATEDTAIKCNDIFRPLPGQDKVIRTVLTKGVAGIGKTVSVQKLILDWAEGKENLDVQLIFPLPFREINLMKDKTLSLSDLLHVFFPETKEMEISSDEYKVLFIFDGLDECRLSLDFKSKVKLCNISKAASVDVLLMNLIVGNLLPSALIWITSRPAANYINVFNQTKQSVFSKILNQKKYVSLSELHKRAVDESLRSKNGHLDLFLRFLLGLSLESNQTLLRELVTQTGSCSYNKEETVEFIKQKIRENHSSERSINLFHCLNELGDDSLMQEIQDYLRSGQIGETKLSSSQWSALVYVLLTSEQEMVEFNLKQFVGAQNTADEVLQKLLPVIKESRSVQLRDCGVTDEGCAALASALRSNPSHLRELDLTGNKLGASGVKRLSDGLKDPRCKLEKLWLRDCGVTDEGCAALASALRSNPSHLRDLSLSGNKLGASGVKRLSDLLKDPRCKLKKLWLRDCGVTEEGCAALASALRSNPSHLRDLSLSRNKLRASGVKRLSDLLKDPRCKLEKLWLSKCGVTDEGCAALASALRSNPSHLRDLSLSGNKLGASGVKLLSDLKDDPHYKLKTLE